MLAIAFGPQALASPVLVNGDFSRADKDGQPLGWEVQVHGLRAALDHEVVLAGERSLRIDEAETPHSALISQVIEGAVIHDTARTLTGQIRTRGILQSATLVVVVNGPEGPLFSDDMNDRVVSGDSDWAEYKIHVPAMPEAESVMVAALVIGPGTAWFDDFHFTEATRVTAATAATVEAYVLEALDLIEESYVHADSIDWSAIRDQAMKDASAADSMERAHLIVASALARLNDRHASFVRPRRSETDSSAAIDQDIRQVSVELIAGRIGLVEVPTFNYIDATKEDQIAFADNAHMRLGEIDSEPLCGWILDLRYNGGGNAWPMLASIGPLAGEGRIGGHVGRFSDYSAEISYRSGVVRIDGNAESIERIAVSTRPFRPRDPGLPVAVLLSGNTASSGESVALAFVGRNLSRSFGLATAGLTSANITIPLSDGARLVFPVAYATDRYGEVYEAGIDPDVVTQPEAALEAASEWLLAQDACRH